MKNRSYVKVEFGADIPWGVTLGEKNLNNNMRKKKTALIFLVGGHP